MPQPTHADIEKATAVAELIFKNPMNPMHVTLCVAEAVAQSRHDGEVRVGRALMNAVPKIDYGKERHCVSVGQYDGLNEAHEKIKKTLTSLGIDLDEPKEHKKPKFID